ncbi:MAG: hypothetical protein M3016_10185 [Actinomycetota bacterium]|nr:hypothetical protein [Actinomycetota bacterium]
MKTQAQTTNFLGAVRQIWDEMEYSQRRLVEMRTGIRQTEPHRHRRARHEIDRLEALYAADGPDSLSA